MKVNLRLIIGATATLLLVSCISTKKYQSLQSENKTLQGRYDAIALDNINCQSSLASANARITGLQEQIIERQR